MDFKLLFLIFYKQDLGQINLFVSHGHAIRVFLVIRLLTSICFVTFQKEGKLQQIGRSRLIRSGWTFVGESVEPLCFGTET